MRFNKLTLNHEQYLVKYKANTLHF